MNSQGDQSDRKLDVEVDDLKGLVEPYRHFSQIMETGQAFIVRSTDFTLRVKIIVWKNTDRFSSKKRPYKITMKNLLMSEPVQVKLSLNHGYQWIEPGTYITKQTDVLHDYTFMDTTGKTLLTVRLSNVGDEL